MLKSLFALTLSTLLIAIVGCGDQTPRPPRQFVVYDFSATWCRPCRVFEPTFEKWKTKYARDNVAFKTVNVDEDQETARKFKIEAFPTIIVTADGKEVGRFVGAPQEEEVADLLK